MSGYINLEMDLKLGSEAAGTIIFRKISAS